MVKGGQNLPADVIQVIDQLERHCLSPDGSLISKSAYYDLQLAREEMSRERLRYLEAMKIPNNSEDFLHLPHNFRPPA
ncbi:hypothetical protein ES332_D05G434800v1 [Gossypium tomentosum]|uniref:Uncharacterized protein n=1 Tax=Gossypium tomentosum TaxID=34277 RepID=A0A5D2L6Y9_GOSTO|nr:hypothetical protein ES332_D05G434800v1 [Gossypium tomentosum]